MKYWEVVKIYQETGARCKRPMHIVYANPHHLKSCETDNDADDWEVEEKKYTVTKSQFEKAWEAHYAGDPLSEFLKALGIE